MTLSVYLFFIRHQLILRIENKEEKGTVLFLTRRGYSLYVFCQPGNQRLSKSTIYGWRHRNLLKKMTIKIDYTQLPWIAGSSRNHMICNCPTTSHETFNDGYNIKCFNCLLLNPWSHLHWKLSCKIQAKQFLLWNGVGLVADTVHLVIFVVVLFSWFSRVSLRKNFHFNML